MVCVGARVKSRNRENSSASGMPKTSVLAPRILNAKDKRATMLRIARPSFVRT
jgi:hypothetical protein